MFEAIIDWCPSVSFTCWCRWRLGWSSSRCIGSCSNSPSTVNWLLFCRHTCCHRFREVTICWGNARRIVIMSMSDFFIPPWYFLFNSLECCAIFSSVVFSYGRGRRCAYFQRGVLRSSLVPISPMSILQTRTFGTQGPWITVVVREVRRTVLPGSRVSQSTRKSFFDRVVTFWASWSSNDFWVKEWGSSVSGERWIVTLICFSRRCIVNHHQFRFCSLFHQSGDYFAHPNSMRYCPNHLQLGQCQRLDSDSVIVPMSNLLNLETYLYFKVGVRFSAKMCLVRCYICCLMITYV